MSMPPDPSWTELPVEWQVTGGVATGMTVGLAQLRPILAWEALQLRYELDSDGNVAAVYGRIVPAQ